VPITLTRWKLDEIGAAYRAMAEAGYRPAASSDGLGNIRMPTPELNMDHEIRSYAERFVKEEDVDRYWAGCTHGEFLEAAVWTLEAFRLMNGGRIWG
jgi:predicted GTPase